MAIDGAHLPIHDVADALLGGLSDYGRVVLSAPTGSGKSTQVPQLLLDRGGVEGSILVPQPRRMAARLLAKRVAAERGGAPGGEVGYQVRFENVTGPGTRIRYLTEAIFLRRLLADPTLPGVGAVVFDEFHERHLDSDLALSRVRDAVETVRPDLRVVVMSATLEVERVKAFLAPCAEVRASGRLFPVEERYLGAAMGHGARPVWERAAAAFRKAVGEMDAPKAAADGDGARNVLVFMPGAREIRRTLDVIGRTPEAKGFEVLPLHGELPPAEQDRAVAPGDRPKVIVATNVAETSITIEGVRVVIDGGLARVARFDPRRGVNTTLTESVSRASADQRAGRAGRTGPGLCLRLWSEAEHEARPARDTPEVLRVDLAEAALLLLASGADPFGGFRWFEKPPEEALERAARVLRDLGALDPEGGLTDTGRAMAGFPVHPRHARLLLEAAARGVLETAALAAAFTQDRPFYRASPDPATREEQVRRIEATADHSTDFAVLLQAWRFARDRSFERRHCEPLGIHAWAARRAGDIAAQLVRLARERLAAEVTRDGGDSGEADAGAALRLCLLAAFPDHVALRLDSGTRRCRMVGGQTAQLRRESVVRAPLMVGAEVEEREVGGEATLLLGLVSEIEPEWLESLFPGDVATRTETVYDPAARRVVCRRERRFRDLALESGEGGVPEPGKAAELLAEEVMAGNLCLKHWNAEVERFIRRINFTARHCPEAEITPLDGEGRALIAEQVCEGATGYKAIKDRPVLPVVRQWLTPEQLYCVETWAPDEIALPRRRRPVKVRYEEDGRAVLSAKLQDFYGATNAQLRIANGAVPLTLELLAPNGRPAHVTDDLDGFWTGAYPRVKRELAGRYPKHEWR